MGPKASVHWYVTRRGAVDGPHAEAVLRQMYVAGDVLPEDKVWAEGEPEWRPAVDMFGSPPQASLFGLLARRFRRLWPRAVPLRLTRP